MKPISIRTKLTLWFAGLFVVVLVSSAAFFYHVLIARVDRFVNARLEHLCTGLWGYIRFDNGQPKLAYNRDDPDVARFVQDASRYFQLYDGESGRVLLQSSSSDVQDLVLPAQQAINIARHSSTIDSVFHDGFQWRFYNGNFHAAGRPYLLRVGVRTVLFQNVRRQVLETFLILFSPSVLLALVAGWYVTKNLLQPVENLRRTAYEISISRLDRRLPLRGTGDELDALAMTFNEVFHRLHKAVEDMKQFTASISHELRTPLALLQAEAEVTLKQPRPAEEYQRVLISELEEFQHLRWLIDRLLELAKAEAGDIPLQARPVELPALLCSLVEQVRPLALAKDISLGVNCAAVPSFSGDPQWLERAALNLLDNAIKFTPEGGSVRVQLTSSGGYARVEVVDTGIGIPPEAMARIFDRFYQVNAGRGKQTGGIGLGLTIAKWIVEAHRGTIQVESELGAGTRFSILLPLTESAAAARA